MSNPVLEFTAHGSLRELSSAIEACAAERRLVNALVVPWESTPDTVNIAITSSKVDGWAIEHTNLGTVTLSRLEDGRAQVTVTPASGTLNTEPRTPNLEHEPGTGNREPGTEVLSMFARQLEKRLAATRPPAGQPR